MNAHVIAYYEYQGFASHMLIVAHHYGYLQFFVAGADLEFERAIVS